MKQNSKNDKLEKEILALFILMSKYNNSKEVKNFIRQYRVNRDIVKDTINRLYVKYSKDGKLNYSLVDMNKELKAIENMLKDMGNNIVKQENDLLEVLLPLVFLDTYNRVNKLLGQGNFTQSSYINEQNKEQSIKYINKKINGKSMFDRTKDNTQKFINNTNKHITNNIMNHASIDKINKAIDNDFNIAVNAYDRLIDNEVVRNVNGAMTDSFINNGITKVMYNSALEDNTCNVCEALDGTVFEIENAPDLPLHINCHCFYTPILKV